MRIHRILLLILGLIAIMSCGPKLDQGNKALYDQVMEIHDEVMPKMSDIHKAKKALKKLKNDTNGDKIDAMIVRLDEADDAMMGWMHEFDVPEGDAQKAKAYLTEQMDEIKKVRTEMLSAIESAQSLKNQIDK